MCWQECRDHLGCPRQREPLRRESSRHITSDLDVYRENPLETYDHDKSNLNLEFLVSPLELERVISQLIIVLVPPASFENTRREVLRDRSVPGRVTRRTKPLTGSLSCC